MVVLYDIYVNFFSIDRHFSHIRIFTHPEIKISVDGTGIEGTCFCLYRCIFNYIGTLIIPIIR